MDPRFLKRISVSRIAISCLGILNVILAVFLWREHGLRIQEVGRHRQAEVQAARRASSELRDRASDAEKKVKSLEALIRESGAGDGTASAVTPEKKAQIATAAKQLVADWMDMTDDPDTMNLIGIRDKAVVRRKFAPLFHNLNLSQAQMDSLTDLIVQRKNSPADVAAASTKAGIDITSDMQLYEQAIKKARDEIDGNIKSEFGDNVYAAYRQFAQAQNAESVISKLQQSLSYGNEPLSGAQSTQLLAELAAQHSNKVTPRVLQAAGTFLSPSQIEMLRGIQSEQDASLQLQLLHATPASTKNTGGPSQ